jgi:AcrR family transcriptional regulator
MVHASVVRRTIWYNNVVTQAELLPRVIDELARNGLAGRSLRDIAAAIGTSHRMLIHHFGSRDGLLTAVVHAVEDAQRAAWADLDASDDLDAMIALWQRLSQPEYWPHERLFYECYARALQGQEPFAALLPGLIHDWVDPAVTAEVGRGATPEQANAQARLRLAVFRGLLLDLLATGDRGGVDRAFDEFVTMARTRERNRPRGGR